MDARNALFGNRGRPGGGLPGRPGQGQSPAQVSGPSAPSSYGYDGMSSPGVADRPSSSRAPGRQPDSYRPQQTGPTQAGTRVQLSLSKVDDKTLQSIYIFSNICAVSPRDFPENRDGSDLYVKLSGPQMQGQHVVNARPTPGFPPGSISLSDPQRTWLQVAMTDTLVGELYDPFSQRGGAYLGSMDLEIGFASPRKITDAPYDQDQLAEIIVQTFANQIFAPGQRFLLDVRNVPLSLVVKTVTLVDLTMNQSAADAPTRTEPDARGIVTNQTSIAFYKSAGSPMKLAGSTKRAGANAILAPNFKFEDMGIGGLDNEFATIFRRAFASRVFPPGLVDKLGIMHVKGILLYGPPGTGKTLIARQIGKMLNAREPKVINGPEVLNKYVGQSEENIRKLFADAEKEYKERGDESGLHIIIFDELDAVCKQRGSGSGGGTGVGDSVVNQLLSKLDGVDQLNNVLLIGMTNRKDMIDDALLRPGRLELQIEISLPDEAGRVQILTIHTDKMRRNGVLDGDVDIKRLAAGTKNFSGAELNGLVKSATSFAFNRHIKVGTTAGVAEDVSQMKVNQSDFELALGEVKPAFGAADEDLQLAMPFGIIPYSRMIQDIIHDAMNAIEDVRKSDRDPITSVLLHGPFGSGKTALATHIALKSQFPFIKAVTPESLVGFSGEIFKKDYIHKVFTDAYKSPLSCLILDNVEELVEWNPVGPRMSNFIVQTIKTLVRVRPPQGHRLLVLATTSERHVLDQLGMLHAFDLQVAVPALRDTRELSVALQGAGFFDQGDATQAVNALRSYTNTDRVNLGIKQVLKLAQRSQYVGDGDDQINWFAGKLAELVAGANA